MPAPDKVLAWLLGGALGAAGLLYHAHWRATGSPADTGGLHTQLRQARDEIALLSRENESLRSLAQGGGTMAVEPGWIQRVEQEFGLNFLSSPMIHRIAGEELRNRISASYESAFGPSGLDDRQEAYRRIGWLGPEDGLLAQLTLVRSFGARGWFDEVTGEAWVTDRFDLEEVPDQAVLVRLLTRILLNQHFPPPPSYPGDDAARARIALHQGAAAGAETRHYSASARTMGFVPVAENLEARQVIESLPEFIRGLSTFPATEGRGFTDALFVQSPEKLQNALRNPVQTTRQIIEADAPAPDGPLELPETPEEPYLSETAGQLGLRLWLPEDNCELASAWRNDRYLLFPDGPASTAVLWDIELESAEAAKEFSAIALSRIATRAKQPEASLDSVLETSEKRLLRVSRPAPNRVRFLNAATHELLSSIP